MHLADISSTELMVPVIKRYCFLVSPQQFAGLDPIHLTLAFYAEQIFQDSASRPRLEFGFCDT
jgi:hypothetical protein